ncbi:MAG: alpha/beta hydrolase [Actinomycetota bacterium]|nr:alpha/beta hydrolase [Actinomycetota bacterium]
MLLVCSSNCQTIAGRERKIMTSPASTTITTTPAELYWEARGSGRPVLLVAGTPGDGGQFDTLAERLAQQHLVITYDRRGTSRSALARGSHSTSVAEQADDAAAVLAAVGVEPAVVYGTSNGAAIALELALRHPHRVAGVMLHEMPLLCVLRDPEPVATAIGSMIGTAMQAGGPAAALEAFLRFAYGDPVVDAWPDELLARMLSNAEMVFSVELPAFQSYRPDERSLAGNSAPAAVLVGQDQPQAFFAEAAQWLAARLATEVTPAPGAHGPQFSCPDALATCISNFSEAAHA